MSEFEAKNREHFDAVASNYLRNFHDQIKAAIKVFETRRLWIRKEWAEDISTETTARNRDVRMLDYACGPGTATKALGPFVTQAVGLDLSENMVAEYNKYAREMGFDPGRMQAYRHNLLDDEQTSLPVGDKLARNFDVAVTSGALHHVSDPAKLLQCLAKCLKADGGVCVVMDRAPSPTNTHVEAAMSSSMPKVLNTINKHTFSEVEMRQLYANAGMSKNFDYVLLPEPFEFTLQGNRMKVCGFLARGELD